MAGTERAAATPGDKKNPVFLLAFPKKRRQKHRMIVTNLPTPGHVVPSTEIEITPQSARNFWAKVKKTEDGCWEWTGYRNPAGYGRLTLNRCPILCHRVSYVMHFGDFDDQMLVCHHCDNPACVRPEHLFLGTDKDNADDRDYKGRWKSKNPAKGNRVWCAKLDDQKVVQIRELHADGISQRELARRFRVDRNAIRLVVKRIGWKHVL